MHIVWGALPNVSSQLFNVNKTTCFVSVFRLDLSLGSRPEKNTGDLRAR